MFRVPAFPLYADTIGRGISIRGNALPAPLPNPCAVVIFAPLGSAVNPLSKFFRKRGRGPR